MKKTIKKGKIFIVVGGNYGSESKGLFASYLCKKENINFAVRTGSINAGHTVYFNEIIYKNQQIPVGWVNPETKLVLGAGSYIHIETLKREVDFIEKATGKKLAKRLFIDVRAGLHSEKHKKESKGRHEKFGTVGEGVSSAISERIRREEGCQLFKSTAFAKENEGKFFQIVDTVKMLNSSYDNGGKILLEGTQGTLLDVYLGNFPFTTSRQTIAANWMAEAGLSPNLDTEIAMVCRTFPIRVAGNSGPMPKEIEWADLLREMNNKRFKKNLFPLVREPSIAEFELWETLVAKEWGISNHCLSSLSNQERATMSGKIVNFHREVLKRLNSETVKDLIKVMEMTTVTKKLRRIARMDIKELEYAVHLNRPDYLVLFFLNYEFPELWGLKIKKIKPQILRYLKNIEKKVKTPIKYTNWRPNQVYEINLG